MRGRIYTIPLREVMAPGLGCPFCLLESKAEEAMLRVYLEGMLVEVDWRGRLLRDWLCLRHLRGLQMETRKLGGAILTQALLRQALTRLADGRSRAPLPAWGSSCLACQDLARTVRQHAEAYLHTWLTEQEFRDFAARGDPPCLPHLALLHREAGRFPRRRRDLLRAELLDREKAALEPLLAEVDWFVQKFDARFHEEPWRGAEDAVERAVVILAGDR